MSGRRKIPAKLEAGVLADNLHTCCICRMDHMHVQLHHIDGNSGNNEPQNLAVVCLNCHSRVTSNEGLGRRYSPLEVAERKRRWELECRVAIKATAERRLVETAMQFRTSLEITGQDFLRPIFVNPELARSEGAKVGFRIGPGFGVSQFEEFMKVLKRAKKLRKSRPNTFKEYDFHKLIFERVNATKIVFPHTVLRTNVPQVRELAVWVADPEEQILKTRDDNQWNFPGTFLYLLTPLYDHPLHETFLSGCSALQVISNMITGKPFITRDVNEPLGRHSFLHPTDKLRSLGGIVIDRREVETLYVCRYMSDEQCFATDEATYRGHDLLAYPLFIRNVFDTLKAMTARIRSTDQ